MDHNVTEWEQGVEEPMSQNGSKVEERQAVIIKPQNQKRGARRGRAMHASAPFGCGGIGSWLCSEGGCGAGSGSESPDCGCDFMAGCPLDLILWP
eukprot:scaffold105151_cov18-Tisochrysis_lutea.AAC.1